MDTNTHTVSLQQLNEINTRVQNVLRYFDNTSDQDDVLQLVDGDGELKTLGYDRRTVMEESKGKVAYMCSKLVV